MADRPLTMPASHGDEAYAAMPTTAPTPKAMATGRFSAQMALACRQVPATVARTARTRSAAAAKPPCKRVVAQRQARRTGRAVAEFNGVGGRRQGTAGRQRHRQVDAFAVTRHDGLVGVADLELLEAQLQSPQKLRQVVEQLLSGREELAFGPERVGWEPAVLLE